MSGQKLIAKGYNENYRVPDQNPARFADPLRHEFTVQVRAFDAAKYGAKLGVAYLVALCTSLLKRSVRDGLIVVGEINLGSAIAPIHYAVVIAESLR